MSSTNFNTLSNKKSSELKVAVGIPAFNEEKNIAPIIIKLKKITNTIIVCDDGSTDLTNELSKQLDATVVNHSKNLGYGAAIRTIFLKAKEMDVDVLVTFDADGQHRIEDIDRVIDPIIRNEADIVIGSRFLDEKNTVPKYRKFGIKTITELTNTTTGSKITDAQSGFRAYNKKVIQGIVPTEQGMGVSTEILIKAAKEKFRILEIPIVVSYEGETSTHNPISHGASVIFSTLKFIAIEHPLKFYGFPGLVFLIIGLSFILWTFQLYSESMEIITNVALIGLSSTIFGIILLVAATILYSMVNLVRGKT